MEARDFVQLALLAMGGEIQGATRLQRTVYVLGLMTGCLDDLGYRAHSYGPYSNDVADAIGWLWTIGAVDRTYSSGGTVDRSGFKVPRHGVRLNERGRKFIEATVRRHSELMSGLEDAARIVQQISNVDHRKLRIAIGTYLMLHGADERPGDGDQADLTTRFGWEVTPMGVREAAEYLECLGLPVIAPSQSAESGLHSLANVPGEATC